jgi:aconitase A
MSEFKSAPLPDTQHRYVPLSQAGDVARLPITVKILLEGVLRAAANGKAADRDATALAKYPAAPPADASVPFRPSRILLQDYTGVPAAVDLAAMRAAMQRAGKDPAKIEPLIPVDLIIDHSVQADFFGARDVYERNLEREYERNRERYSLLRWAGQAFKTFRVVPPGAGICHQVNLERLAEVVVVRDGVAMPDTLFGADSHTTMINGLGVLGWGVGGIEAEAAMLGQPTYLPWPIVVGVKLVGKLPIGTTATDLVLTLTELFRRKGVVNKFIEFAGDGLSSLAVAERATVANMCPEYGATSALFPVDRQTLRYLEQTGRPRALIELVERYTNAQRMFRSDGAPTPEFDELIEVDLGSVKPSVAGPKRPQDRVDLPMIWDSFTGPKPTSGVTPPGASEGPKKINDAAPTMVRPATAATAAVAERPRDLQVSDGSVVVAAITSCTNTSNPSVMIAAGLLAKKAIELGLRVQPHVKTTFAPGSRVVTRYLEAAGLTPYLEQLGFFLVGFGCTVCIAEGTPVLQGNGTARRIEDMPTDGGASVFGPAPDGGVTTARQTALIRQGTRDCVSLTLQDGRVLSCTPDHEILRADGRWVRADELRPGIDRVISGLEAPLDIPQLDEAGYELHAGSFAFTMETPAARQRTLAFARLLGHLLDDGSISVLGQARINVGQAVDRETVLGDVELITGRRPAGTRYDERKWSIALPMELAAAIVSLRGVRVGRRIDQPPVLPSFVLDERCPVAIVREFLGGTFGADGTAPVLKRFGKGDEDGSLEQPGYSHAVKPEHVNAQKDVMRQLLDLLARCSVRTAGAAIREYPVRHSASSYAAADEAGPRIEVRLELPDGLSFVTAVGFRYCVDKALRASAAAVYWRELDSIHRQRLWMSDRIRELHAERPELSFRAVREIAASELEQREPVVFPHCSTLEGATKYGDLPTEGDRTFRPLHRKTCGFPSPVALLREMGVREWFAPLKARETADFSKRYCVGKESLALPTFSLKVLGRREAGERAVFDLSVDELHAFIANGISVHNCIGNTGPLATPEIEQEVKDRDLNVVSILSGNRNFEGRIHPLVKSSYLASPPLVVAFALAGTVHIDLQDQPIGNGKDGKPVFLKDLWPSPEEVNQVMGKAITQEMYATEYAKIFDGDRFWKTMPSPTGLSYQWDPSSTYVQEPPFFQNFSATPPATISDIVGARVLVSVGDSVTTDHISPAGAIPAASPAGEYLISKGVKPVDFNQYGTRRGNHEVLIRGTFANLRLRNKLADKEGWWTRHFPSGEGMTIYDAAIRYQRERVPLVVFAGKEYGSGSSRDWAAKGPNLMGVRAAIAESFERIHRSNLVMMGVLPLEFTPGETMASLGLTGQETFTIRGLGSLAPRARLTVEATSSDGKKTSFQVLARVDDPTDVEYVRQGGILQQVLRERIAAT